MARRIVSAFARHSAASVFFGFLFLCPFYGLGGDDGIRTHDPLLAGQVLSQLSYTPIGVTLVSRVVQFLSKTILFDSP